MRELLVRERTDEPSEQLHDLAGARERAGHEIALLRRRVHELRHTALPFREAARGVAEVETLERRRGDDHEVDGNPFRFAPHRLRSLAAVASRTVRVLTSFPFATTVCDAGARHAPRHRRLVARMIDARNPVTRAIRPVVAEVRPTSRAVDARRSIRRSPRRRSRPTPDTSDVVPRLRRQRNLDRLRPSRELHRRGRRPSPDSPSGRARSSASVSARPGFVDRERRVRVDRRAGVRQIDGDRDSPTTSNAGR